MSTVSKYRNIRRLQRISSKVLVFAVCLPFIRTALAEETISMATRLTIQGLEEGQLVSEHDLGIIKFEVRLEQKKIENQPLVKFDVKKLRVQVNQQSMKLRHLGHGSGHEGDVIYRTHGLAIRPGMPGPIRLTLQYDHMKAERSFTYQPKGQLELLDLIDRQAILRDEAAHIRWLGAYIDPDSLTLTVNDRAHTVEASPGLAPGLHIGTAEGLLTPGVNNIELAAKDIFGSEICLKRTVFYYPQNIVPKGAVFALPMGRMGSKSGPFFRARPVGAPLHMFKAGAEYPYVSHPVLLELEKDGLRAKRGKFVLAFFKAVAPGKTLVRIVKKRYFRDKEWRIDRVIELKIEL